MLVRFGSFQIDDQRFELRHGETLVERLHSFCPLRQDGLGREVTVKVTVKRSSGYGASCATCRPRTPC